MINLNVYGTASNMIFVVIYYDGSTRLSWRSTETSNRCSYICAELFRVKSNATTFMDLQIFHAARTYTGQTFLSVTFNVKVTCQKNIKSSSRFFRFYRLLVVQHQRTSGVLHQTIKSYKTYSITIYYVLTVKMVYRRPVFRQNCTFVFKHWGALPDCKFDFTISLKMKLFFPFTFTDCCYYHIHLVNVELQYRNWPPISHIE